MPDRGTLFLSRWLGDITADAAMTPIDVIDEMA